MTQEATVCRNLLAVLQAQYWHYTAAHWQAKGDAFYGDHLLFQRLYESVQAQIDTLAEKIVGQYGPEFVAATETIPVAHKMLDHWAGVDCLHRRSLQAEQDFQTYLKAVYEALKNNRSLTLGLDDFLMGMASEHETNQYLVQQVLGGVKTASSWDAWNPRSES